MPPSSAPEPRGPAGRRDPVRPATPPHQTTGGHRRGVRASAPTRTAGPPRTLRPTRTASPTRIAAGRYRPRCSDPVALPTTVWLLAAPTAPVVVRPAVVCPSDVSEVVGSANSDGVAEIVRRAVAAFVPHTSTAQRGPTVVITRPAPAPVAGTAGASYAPGSSSGVPPGAVPRHPTAIRPTPTGIGETVTGESTAGDPLVGEVGAGLVLLDATRTPGVPIGVDDVAGGLAPGGVLAVLTASDRVAGRLRDPRPALIAAARAAGLDYWQHIVTATRPADHLERLAEEDYGSFADGQQRPVWCLFADVSVFRRPVSTNPADADRTDEPAQAATPTEVQP